MTFIPSKLMILQQISWFCLDVKGLYLIKCSFWAWWMTQMWKSSQCHPSCAVSEPWLSWFCVSFSFVLSPPLQQHQRGWWGQSWPQVQKENLRQVRDVSQTSRTGPRWCVCVWENGSPWGCRKLIQRVIHYYHSCLMKSGHCGERQRAAYCHVMPACLRPRCPQRAAFSEGIRGKLENNQHIFQGQ